MNIPFLFYDSGNESIPLEMQSFLQYKSSYRKRGIKFRVSLYGSPYSCVRGLRQWRTEHKCRPGRRREMPPFQEKMSSNSPEFLTTFLVIDPKDENFFCRPPPLSCAALNFQLFCPFLLRITPF